MIEVISTEYGFAAVFDPDIYTHELGRRKTVQFSPLSHSKYLLFLSGSPLTYYHFFSLSLPVFYAYFFSHVFFFS